MTKDKRHCLSAWNCCQDSQLSWPLLPRLQLHVAGKTWAETAHCTGLRYAAMLWFLGVNFLWIRTSLDISGHLWTFGSFGWLRVGFELAKWLVEMELDRSSVRISCVPWEGFPTRQRTRVAKKKEVYRTKYHEMWELWERHVNCKCEPIHCDSSGLFL